MVPPKNFLAYLLIVFRGIIGEPFFLFFYKSLFFFTHVCVFFHYAYVCVFFHLFISIFKFVIFHFLCFYFIFFTNLTRQNFRCGKLWIWYSYTAKLSVRKVVVDLIVVYGKTFGDSDVTILWWSSRGHSGHRTLQYISCRIQDGEEIRYNYYPKWKYDSAASI